MPSVKSLAAVASDFARVMANAEEAMAETVSRAWNEAKEEIARDLARATADVHARFEDIALTTRAAIPGRLHGAGPRAGGAAGGARRGA
jgi:hypothetical protein